MPDICPFSCSGEDYCKGSDIELICVGGQTCSILCDGKASCQDATIVPNGASDVFLRCTGGQDVCGSTTLNCGNGDCRVECDFSASNSCDDIQVNLNAANSFACTGDCPGNVPAAFNVPTSSVPFTISTSFHPFQTVGTVAEGHAHEPAQLWAWLGQDQISISDSLWLTRPIIALCN